MNRFGKNTRLFRCSVAFLFFILPVFVLYHSKGIAQETNADNIESIKIMTINLLFSEVDDRNKRLKSIADYVAANQIDVLLLQEVVGGELVNTDNSAEDLKDLLRDRHDLKYNERTAFEIGINNLLEVGNAILSRFKIVSWDDHELPGGIEEEFLGFDVKLPRRVIMMRLLIPGFGEIDVFNTHLCARCSPNDQEDQLDELFDYIEKKNKALRPAVLGGDMNFDLFDNDGEERFLYDEVIIEGFSDAYADYIIAASGGKETLESLCEDEDNADEHCTVGVSDLNGPNARRIDYIFARDFWLPVYSQVVFNPDAPNGVPPTVSDHAAVVVHLPFQLQGDTIPLPSAAEYGNIMGSDQSHVNEVNYIFEGRTGDILLDYEVWDVDVSNEVQILLNGVEIGFAPLTGNEAWSGRQVLPIPDSLVNDTADNYLTFNNTFNPPNAYWWGVRYVSVPSLSSGDEIVIERVKDSTFFWSTVVTVSPFVTEITGRYHDIDFDPGVPQIDILFNEAGGFGQADFNGFRFWDMKNTIAEFKKVSIWSSNIPGFDESRIAFNGNNIYMNFEGLAFDAGDYVSLRIGN